MTITIQEFTEQSTRTAPFNATPQNNIEWQNLLGNYSMGLVGEHMEYELELSKVAYNGEVAVSEETLDKVESEIGDVLHYAVNLLTMLGEEFNDLYLVDEVNAEDITEALGNILEIPKKHIYHGHEFKKEEYVSSIYVIISEFTRAYGDTLGYILDKNIEKLKKRYPEKFTVEDSIARVDTK